VDEQSFTFEEEVRYDLNSFPVTIEGFLSDGGHDSASAPAACEDGNFFLDEGPYDILRDYAVFFRDGFVSGEMSAKDADDGTLLRMYTLKVLALGGLGLIIFEYWE
jgi:hypothetical protein